MVRRVHLKRKFKIFEKKKIPKLCLVFILLFIALIIIFNYINKKIAPYIIDYATVEAKNIASFVMNKAISKNISAILNVDELFVISKNANDEINMIDFNPIIVNNVLTSITEVVHTNLKNLEKGNTDELELPYSAYLSSISKRNQGIIFEIPSGIVFSNALLSNIGPKIPVRLSFIGDIISNIETKVTNYGINNALIEIELHLTVTEKVILPVTISEVDLELKVPLALKVIQGNIPNYYLSGLNESSSILKVPVE